MEDEYRLKMMPLPRRDRGKVRLTADDWPSRIYEGYKAVTAHWIDEK